MTFQRSVDGGRRGRPSGPTTRHRSTRAIDDTVGAGRRDAGHLPRRARLRHGHDVTSAARTVAVVQARVTTATVHYHRPNGGYAAGACTCSATGSRPARRPRRGRTPTPFEGTDAYGVFHGSTSPTTRSGSASSSTAGRRRRPQRQGHGPDRYFIPLATPEIWLRAGRRRGSSTARRPTTAASCRRRVRPVP